MPLSGVKLIDPMLQLGELLFLLFSLAHHGRRDERHAIHRVFAPFDAQVLENVRAAVKDAGQGVIIVRADRIELMIVATRNPA